MRRRARGPRLRTAISIALVVVAGAACGRGAVGASAGRRGAGARGAGGRDATAGTAGQGDAGRALRDPREVHLADLRPLGAAGAAAAPSWSFHGKALLLRATRPPHACDGTYRVPLDGGPGAGAPELVSTGRGRSEGGAFYPGDRRVVYASTHAAGERCSPAAGAPPAAHLRVDSATDLFSARPDGSELARLTDAAGYDGGVAVCGRDGSLVFTSARDGDLELYRMDADGRNARRLTHAPGADLAASLSADCARIVWLAARPTGEERAAAERLLGRGLVRARGLEIWVAAADGSNARQVTYLDAVTSSPSFFPSGDRILFASGPARGGEGDVELWAIDVDGTRLERLTWTPGFDGFPALSRDGERLAFVSSRGAARPRAPRLHVARWVDGGGRGGGAAGARAAGEDRAPDRFLADVRWLADDAREGRGAGSAGLEAAASYVEERLRALGVEPAFAGGSYRQPVEVAVAVRRGASTAMWIDGRPLEDEDFVPLGLSGGGAAEGPVVAAGHGVTAPELGVDDYRGVNARGRVVVVRRFTPQGGRFDAEGTQRRYGDPRYKAWNARAHGARALVIVDLPAPAARGPAPGPPEGGRAAAAAAGRDAAAPAGAPAPGEAPLPGLQVEQFGDAGIPVVVVTRARGAALLEGRHQVRLLVALEVERRAVHNLVGRVPAGAPAPERARSAVVVGAHYDHLGMGDARSMVPGLTATHNGADDNASGTAALLEAARTLVARRAELRRDVYVVAFAAEELGAVGARAFVARPPPGLAIRDVVAMLNLDMVGRLRGNALAVLGGGTADAWPELVGPACARARLACALDDGDGFTPSDQVPFIAAGVPALQLHTGAHSDYHTPTDDAALVNAAGGAQIAALVADLAAALARREARLVFRAAPPSGLEGDARANGAATLGLVPDYTGDAGAGGPPGVLLAGVRAGGPAAAAGLRRGDRLLRVGAHEVRNVQDLLFVLRAARPGDRARLVWDRAGRRRSAPAAFGRTTRAR